MSGFEDQIEAHRKNDADALNNAYSTAVDAVLGENFSFFESEDALTAILNYYNIKNIKIPERIKEDSDRMAEMCRTAGLMYRNVKLTKGWYHDAFGAFLCRKADTNEYVAVLPDKFGRYFFHDEAAHKTRRLNRKTEKLLSGEGICFYKGLPAKKIGFEDVLKFSISSLNIADFALTYVILAATTLLGLLQPELNNFLFSEVVDSGNFLLAASTMVFILNLSISILFLNAMGSVFNKRISVKIGAMVQSAAMMRVLSLPPEFFRRYSTGELTERMKYMETVFAQLITISFSTVLSALFSLAYITQIFRYAPALAVPSLCIILANAIFSVYSTLRQIKISRLQAVMSSEVTGKSIEMISGIEKIKTSGSEKRMFANYVEDFSKLAKLQYNPPAFNKYSSVFTLAISLAGELIIYYETLNSNIDAAAYYAFQTSYAMISAAITNLTGVALQAASLRPAIEMIEPILKTIPEDGSDAYPVQSLTGGVELCDVSFKYPGNPRNILDDFSLRIEPGEYVAIVGKTGCGKSTLIRLLLGFEKPQMGAIYYDNMDLNTLDKRSLRRKIGTVMQNDKLFAGDLYSNIVICAPNLPMEAAWEAAETAGIADDIRKMPMGMNTVVTEGGGGISGGQRQRLAIARAIAPKPSILILDEATSALDNITQRRVSEALDRLNCTRIVIAHRLSTIRHCDRIIVMDQGRVVDEGTYDELIKKNEFFAELVERQRLDIHPDQEKTASPCQ